MRTNLLYHLLTTGLVWLLARQLLRHPPTGRSGALAAATLFAVHPIRTGVGELDFDPDAATCSAIHVADHGDPAGAPMA